MDRQRAAIIKLKAERGESMRVANLLAVAINNLLAVSEPQETVDIIAASLADSDITARLLSAGVKGTHELDASAWRDVEKRRSSTVEP